MSKLDTIVHRTDQHGCGRCKPTLRFLAAAVWFTGLMTTLQGCRPSRTETQDQTIRFAYQDRIADALSIIAVNERLFERQGLKVTALRFSSGPACSEALFSGTADVGTMGDTTAVIATARNAPVSIVVSHGGGEHRHRIIISQKAGLRSVADLRGKRVAVKKGTSTYGGWLAFLQEHDIPLSAVDSVDMRPSDMPDALASGAVAAIVASEPTPSLCEQRGGRELATLGKLGNTYPIMLVMRTAFRREQPDKADAFLRALEQARDIVREEPEKAVGILANATGLPKHVTRRAMSFHSYQVALDAVTLESLTETARFLVEQRVIDHVPTLPEAASGTSRD